VELTPRPCLSRWLGDPRHPCVLNPAVRGRTPTEIAISGIDGEKNAEIRPVMIERYRHGEEVSGAAAYIGDAGGEPFRVRYRLIWVKGE
jgi:hypothetical protein